MSKWTKLLANYALDSFIVGAGVVSAVGGIMCFVSDTVKYLND